MPHRFEREVKRIMRLSERPIAMGLDELVLDLDQLQGEAAAGGHAALAAAIGAAADLARFELSGASEPAVREPSSTSS